jgi:uncharacterized membrane protein
MDEIILIIVFLYWSSRWNENEIYCQLGVLLSVKTGVMGSIFHMRCLLPFFFFFFFFYGGRGRKQRKPIVVVVLFVCCLLFVVVPFFPSFMLDNVRKEKDNEKGNERERHREREREREREKDTTTRKSRRKGTRKTNHIYFID